MLIDIHKDEKTRRGIVFAIAGDVKLIDEMKCTGDGNGNFYYDVKFSVGGVELNFQNVIDRLFKYIEDKEKDIDKQVEEKAIELLSNKFNDTIQNLIDIQERINDEENKWKFKWEKSGK